ncbi:MAG TPA: AI-2E family transporter [Gaiellales bacterium]|jgi:predicted PurR-regulated permease PerM|nr:AI-2E family transporter [Gaiellales bacterium]
MLPGPQRIVVDLPLRTIVRVVAVVLVTIAAVDILAHVARILIWMATSLFLAVALQPAVRLAERRMSHTLAVFAVFAALLLLVVAFLALLIIPIASQVDELRSAAPTYINDLRHNETINSLNTRYHLVQKAEEAANAYPGKAFGALSKIVSGVVATITVLFLTLFLLLEMPALAEGLLRFFPPERAEQVRRIGGDINRNVAGYVLGNLIISVIAGTVIGISLWILGVPFALALAVFMGVFDLVPLVGATVGALAAIGVAFATQGVTAGIVMIVVNIVYQQIENHVLQPIVYRRTVQLSAFLILIAVLIGGELLGVLGALIAIPVAGSLQLLFRELTSGSIHAPRQPAPEPPPG